jgi:hypothetical protein
MHVEFLVEEPSAEAALNELLPRLIGENTTFQVHPYQCKKDLLDNLPGRLRGYARWLPADWRVVVLVDLDRDDCRKLKARLERLAQEASLTTSSKAKGHSEFQVLNRIAIEELEAWFFGDVEAMRAAYPRVPKTLSSKGGLTNPDAIRGGTWERLEQVLQKAGYFKAGLAKIAAAREIAKHMEPNRNRSKSFAVFRDGLRAMLQGKRN